MDLTRSPSLNHCSPEENNSSPPPPEVAFKSQRSGRALKFPKRYTDFQPEAHMSLPHMPPSRRQILAQARLTALNNPRAISEVSETPSVESIIFAEPLDTTVTTEPNNMGLFRVYPRRPTIDPLEGESLDSVHQQLITLS
ncbi:hypothetical protein OF83DRAFT_1179589 [Amylostereum chailletii]|nr:hypothetical protein OF83DRAFT_1179589 [Amylostereum chailletii]